MIGFTIGLIIGAGITLLARDIMFTRLRCSLKDKPSFTVIINDENRQVRIQAETIQYPFNPFKPWNHQMKYLVTISRLDFYKEEIWFDSFDLAIKFFDNFDQAAAEAFIWRYFYYRNKKAVEHDTYKNTPSKAEASHHIV